MKKKYIFFKLQLSFQPQRTSLDHRIHTIFGGENFISLNTVFEIKYDFCQNRVHNLNSRLFHYFKLQALLNFNAYRFRRIKSEIFFFGDPSSMYLDIDTGTALRGGGGGGGTLLHPSSGIRPPADQTDPPLYYF